MYLLYYLLVKSPLISKIKNMSIHQEKTKLVHFFPISTEMLFTFHEKCSYRLRLDVRVLISHTPIINTCKHILTPSQNILLKSNKKITQVISGGQ